MQYYHIFSRLKDFFHALRTAVKKADHFVFSPYYEGGAKYGKKGLNITSSTVPVKDYVWLNNVRFCLKNITNIKKVNLQNWCQINFLPNRTRVMAEFHFLRF